jgi:hypothetical protein
MTNARTRGARAVWGPLLCVGGAVLLVSGCDVGIAAPARAARAESSQCAGALDAPGELRALESMTRARVESNVHLEYCSGGGQLYGVKMVVPQVAGLSPGKLAQTLQCHRDRLVLGRAGSSELPNDPFLLPGSWVTIEVTAEAGNLVVMLSGDTVADNLRVLQRATAFAAPRGSVTN